MRCVTRLALVLAMLLPAAAAQRETQSGIQRAVEEFRIQTRNLGLRQDSPRRARKLRSGVANWHGRVFWNLRNNAFDAVPHEVTQTGGDQGILHRHQYGFNLSGPLFIPKLYHGGSATFFSITYEGMRETVGRSYLRTIPILPERSGDFSQTVDKSGALLPIFDPLSTRENPNFDPSKPVSEDNLQNVRDPFPGNVIPAGQLDQVALGAVQYYPLPNVSIGPYDQNNYSIYSPERNDANGMRFKLDHNLHDQHRLGFGFNFSNGFQGPPKFFESVANPGRPDREFRSRSGRFEHIYTISPNSVNTLRFVAWTSSSENLGEVAESGQPFPVFDFSPYVSMGRRYPVSTTARTNYEISDGFTFRHGTHSFRVSGEWSWEQVNSFWPTYPSGHFRFTDGLTSQPGIVNTGHAFASFMQGLSMFAEGSLVENPSYLRRQVGRTWFRDEWEVRPGLTLSLSLMTDISTGRIEKYNRQSTVDFDTVNPENDRPGALIFAGRDGHGRSFQPFRFRFEPYVSATWSPFGSTKTVMRASVRRFYRAIPLYSGQWGTQGFNGTPTVISANPQIDPAVKLDEGLPGLEVPLPDLRPEAANDTIADLIDETDRQPTYDYVRFSFERQLPWQFVVSVGGMVMRARHMLADNEGANPNAIPLDDLRYRDLLNDEEFNKSRRPYPQYKRFDVYSSYPVGRYHRSEGYLRVEKRTSQGLSLRMVYEFSKQMDDYSGDGLQDYYNRRNEWALNPYNDPHRVSLRYMYELPFGPNKQFLTAADWKRYIVAGWAISGMTTYSSGDPIRLRAEFNNTGNVVDTLYVNQVPGVEAQVSHPGPHQWFNADAFLNPPDFAIGHVARSHPSLRNPIRQNHDLSVTKRFTITSERAIEFMGTAFNFINHADWNRPDADIGSLESPNTNAGRIIGSRGGRVIQLGLRLTF